MLRVHTWSDGPAEDSKRKLTNRSTLDTGGCIGITRTLISARARSQNGRFHTFWIYYRFFGQEKYQVSPQRWFFLILQPVALHVPNSVWNSQIERCRWGGTPTVFLKKPLKKVSGTRFRYPNFRCAYFFWYSTCCAVYCGVGKIAVRAFEWCMGFLLYIMLSGARAHVKTYLKVRLSTSGIREI